MVSTKVVRLLWGTPFWLALRETKGDPSCFGPAALVMGSRPPPLPPKQILVLCGVGRGVGWAVRTRKRTKGGPFLMVRRLDHGIAFLTLHRIIEKYSGLKSDHLHALCQKKKLGGLKSDRLHALFFWSKGQSTFFPDRRAPRARFGAWSAKAAKGWAASMALLVVVS